MKKVAAHGLILFVFLSLIHSGPSPEASSTFVIKSGTHLVFGRNYDWGIGHGLVIIDKKIR